MIRMMQYSITVLTFLTVIAGSAPAESKRLADNWEFYRGDLGGVWEALRSDKLSGGLPVWEKVRLPHCYNAFDSVDPDTPYYQGPAWYRTQLKIDNPYPGGRTLLHFEGAGQKADIYIDQQKIASHVGGYNEFIVDITDGVDAYEKQPYFAKQSPDRMAKPGVIPLTIRCDNSRDLESIPSSLSDFNVYGGLYRYVNLVYVPAVSFESVHIKTEHQADSWKVFVKGNIFNPAGKNDNVTAAVRILAPDGTQVLKTEKSFAANQRSIDLLETELSNPVLWSTDNPRLYQCVVDLKGPDGNFSMTEGFGFRWFEFAEKGPFYLNGERLLLRGTHRHEDHAGLAAAMTEDLIQKEMRLMKDMGVNFIRLGHYPQSRYVLDLCDELGILVWEEIPWCRGGVGGDAYRQQARNALQTMIHQHRNHPSVIIWGLGNENDWPGDFETFDKEQIRAFMSELNDLAHSLDPQRKTAIRRCNFCSDIVDVYSPSIWAGWYRGKFIEYKDVSESEMKKVNHFLHVEWGGDSHAGRHSENPYASVMGVEASGQADERGLDYLMTGGQARASKDGDWSESYICDLIDWHLKEQETMDWLTGTAFWIFKDFSTPLRPDNPIPYMNQKGAVERDLTPKEAYYVYQSYWTQKPMVRIYAHSWPVRWGKRDEEKTVKVYSNCAQAELFVNGKSAGVKERNSQDFPAAGLRWSVKFKNGINHLQAIARKDGVEVVDEITFRYETRQWKKPARLSLRMMARHADRVTLQAELLDEKGVICLDARDFVQFGSTGDGTLIDNLGTVRGARKVQLANGRAQIDIRLNKGRSAASVTGLDLPTAFLEIAPIAEEPQLKSMTRAQQALEVAQIDRQRILKLADSYLSAAAISIRDYPAPFEPAKPGDFYSMGDYWWPNPDTADGLPYIQRDGQSNPGNFIAHRMAIRRLRDAVAALAAAYALEGNEAYAQKAVELLKVFFVDEDRKMNPHLLYAQAIPGVSTGRGIGIIDTLHLAEVPLAVEALNSSKALTREILAGLKQWFAAYSEWMVTHPQGIAELNAANNHSVAYLVQLASFARLTGDAAKLELARNRFKEIVAQQMDLDGSFPAELARTKPYGYSIFQLDNMSLLCQLLSTESENQWTFELADGRTMSKAIEFLYPYLQDRANWPYPADIEHFNQWPVRQPSLLLAGLALGRADYLELWKTLEADPQDLEIRRNMAVTQPVLWLIHEHDVPLLGKNVK
ncbi:MAG: alginate lyase family protein [Planctomycetaceae bacterium]|nr:alginate lyase family protein [Planctomycetaceae bacterium]